MIIKWLLIREVANKGTELTQNLNLGPENWLLMEPFANKQIPLKYNTIGLIAEIDTKYNNLLQMIDLGLYPFVIYFVNKRIYSLHPTTIFTSDKRPIDAIDCW